MMLSVIVREGASLAVIPLVVNGDNVAKEAVIGRWSPNQRMLGG